MFASVPEIDSPVTVTVLPVPTFLFVNFPVAPTTLRVTLSPLTSPVRLAELVLIVASAVPSYTLFKAVMPVIVNGLGVILAVVEAVVWRVPGIFLEEFLRSPRPDVMVSGRQIEREAGRFNALPLRFGGLVMQALYRVPYADGKCRVFGRRIFKDTIKHARFRLSRPIAENDEAEGVRSLRCRRQQQDGESSGRGADDFHPVFATFSAKRATSMIAL